MAHDVFISYASADQTVAQMVCATLEKQGIRCWMAPRDVQPGEEWGGAIVEAIKASRAMVLVFSGAANDSRHIPREIERAIDREIPLVPVRIENVEPRGSLEYSLSSVHWLDAITPPVEAHIVKLADRLRTMLHRPAEAAPASPPPPPVIVSHEQPVDPPPTAPPVTPRPPAGGRATSRRGLIIAGLVIAGLIWLGYATSNPPPAPAPTPAKPPPSATTPAPTVTPDSTLRVDPDVKWIAFPMHRFMGNDIDPRRVSDLRREADAHPNDERPAIDLAVIFYDARRYEDAIQWFQDALELTPNHLGARIDLAMAYWHIKRNPEALSHLQRVLVTEPRNPTALLNMGVVYATDRRLEMAADCWRHVIEYQPGTWDADRAREMLGKIGAR